MVTFCGGWGYGDYVLRILDAIQNQYHGVKVDSDID